MKERRGDTFEGRNTPEIPDRVKIIARLFKLLTDRPRTLAAFCSLFVATLYESITYTHVPVCSFSRVPSSSTLLACEFSSVTLIRDLKDANLFTDTWTHMNLRINNEYFYHIS